MLLSLGHGFSLVLEIAARIALIVVIATVVRRHRPDAHGSLLVWAVLSLAQTMVTPLLISVIVGTTAGVDAVITVQTVSVVIGTVIHVVLLALLIRGLVKLAQPPKAPEVGAVGPYR